MPGRRRSSKASVQRKHARLGFEYSNTVRASIPIALDSAGTPVLRPFTMAQLLDLRDRQVVMQSVGVQLLPVEGGTNKLEQVSCQLQWFGPLGTADSNEMAYRMPKMMSEVNPTNLIIKTSNPFQRRPLQSDGNTNLFQMEFSSLKTSQTGQVFEVLAIVTTRVLVMPQTNIRDVSQAV